MIGLGRMGLGIALRLVRAGNTVLGFDYNQQACEKAACDGIEIAKTIVDLAMRVDGVWLMIPAGDAVEQVVAQLHEIMAPGTVIIDGGNSKFTDSIRRAEFLAQKGILFVDCGTSGGLYGAEQGYCLMVGGLPEAYEKITPLLDVVSMQNGFAHVGPSGAGHYVKMVHNGIEYALMQSYAEGFQLLKEGSFKDVPLDLHQICSLWNSGSIIRSWLLELTDQVLREDQHLDAIDGSIAETGMGKWTAEEASNNHIAMPALQQALTVRKWSRETHGNYATKLIAMMRLKMGGHAVAYKNKGR